MHLDFAKDFGYLYNERYKTFQTKCARVGSMPGAMIKNPKPFLIK